MRRRLLQSVVDLLLGFLQLRTSLLIAENSSYHSNLDFVAESAADKFAVVQTLSAAEVVTVATDPMRCRLAVAEAEVPPSAWNCLDVLPMGLLHHAKGRWLERLGKPYLVPKRMRIDLSI